jgi:hypothetical protein
MLTTRRAGRAAAAAAATISLATPFDEFVDSVLNATRMAPVAARDNHAMGFGMDAALGPHGVRNGSWSEWGVFKGATLKQMSDRYAARGLIYAFDSFDGLPKTWRPPPPGQGAAFGRKYLNAGSFAMEGRPPALRLPNVAYVVGLFDRTMPAFLNEVRRPASLVHIDCDLYSASKTVLCGLAGRGAIVDGTVLVFDELLGYPEFRDGEIKALWECLRHSGLRAHVLGHSVRRLMSWLKAGEKGSEVWPQAVALQMVKPDFWTDAPTHRRRQARGPRGQRAAVRRQAETNAGASVGAQMAAADPNALSGDAAAFSLEVL